MTSASNSWALDGGVLVRLLGAALLGGLVGIEREATDQPAGLRTHIAVALGAALFGVVSTMGFLEFDRARSESTIQADVSRVASNVAVGIGFLGAGVIFRQGWSIKNLTTSASLWVVAAIGLAAGVGNVTTAAVGTVVLVASLVVLRPIRDAIHRRFAADVGQLEIELDGRDGTGAVVDALGTEPGIQIGSIRIDVVGEARVLVMAELHGRPDAVRRATAHLAGLPSVARVIQG